MSWIPKKTVVLPLDFSESSADALAVARELVARPADLHVVHVLLPLDYLSPVVMVEQVDDASRVKNAQKFCDDFLKKHRAEGTTSKVLVGDPGLMITEYATSAKADLIVIPSHGYHGIKRLVLGSVAERVIRHADCAVLVLRRLDAE